MSTASQLNVCTRKFGQNPCHCDRAVVGSGVLVTDMGSQDSHYWEVISVLRGSMGLSDS